MSSIPSPVPKKKYVTRACDACKKRKSKCDGCEPCQRCIDSGLRCAYNSDYKRGSRRRTTRSLAQNQPLLTAAGGEDASAGLESPSHVAAPINPNNDDRETIRIDHDSGDASVHAFLQKVSGHLAQVGRGLPRNLFSKEQGGLIEDNQASTFVLPSIETAKAYFDCFFDHANTTYRYLPKAEMFELLNRVYAENETVLSDHTNMAIILLIMGIGCIWTASWRNEPLPPWKRKSERFLQAGESRLERSRNTFPPTLAILQAQLLKCQLEIASSQFNSAWMTLGWTIRLGQMIDIQREPTSCSPQEAHFRKSVLYAMFMVDRYLAIALGRPVAMQEHEITATLVMELHPAVSSRLGSQEEKLWVGIVAHVRLTMIMGHIVTQLYPATRNTTAPTEAAVAGLEKELFGWLSDVPEFFHPVQNEMSSREQAFYDVPWIFRRQQRTIRAAFFFANMLIYRDFLLREFLQQAPSTPRSGQCPERVRKCVDNAMAMLMLAAEFGVDEFKYNATFWMTSHFIFCAISILLVYLALYQESDDWNTIELVVEKAMKFHRKLDNSVNIYAQKLLDESRARVEVLRSLNSPSNTVVAHGPTPDWAAVQDQQGLPCGPSPRGTHGEGSPGPYSAFEQHAMDTFGMNNGLDMIMGIGFDRAALPETFGIEGIDLFQQYH
uniref:Zn(2)-C6 fungal-type domain-containing protein n=1 Tax=Bionectria ochroleuca TaxID=29856 RepID=A0A8H7N0W9_BIOOC